MRTKHSIVRLVELIKIEIVKCNKQAMLHKVQLSDKIHAVGPNLLEVRWLNNNHDYE